jgi:hypothetical protein
MKDFTAIYNTFNQVEGFIWIAVALMLPVVFKPQTKQRKWGVGIASFGLVLFGISDFLEVSIHGEIPVVLLVYKIACGAIILSGRHTYLGWKQFSPWDRYFLFGLFCLIAVSGIIACRATLDCGSLLPLSPSQPAGLDTQQAANRKATAGCSSPRSGNP